MSAENILLSTIGCHYGVVPYSAAHFNALHNDHYTLPAREGGGDTITPRAGVGPFLGVK
jgi:hypothetical protein